MKSALYRGIVVHQRVRPRRHRLRYALSWMLFDLDELPELHRSLRFFSYNGRNLLGFRDSDHLDGSNRPLRMQIEAILTQAGLAPDGGRIGVLCMPRVLGSVFNPIAVWFCHRRDGSLSAMLYEVNNTFGQRHCYLIPTPNNDPAATTVRQRCDKQFYVSPFMPMDMIYDFNVTLPGEIASVVVNASDSDGLTIATSFVGHRRAPTDTALLGIVLRHGILALKIVAAIHWEAAKLLLKGMRIQPRPAPPVRTVTIVQSSQG
ncbi:MAG: DUF1365 family protein [Rhodospirillales bacterium]|jgi:hypothetical protein